jgi:hypothetical protein
VLFATRSGRFCDVLGFGHEKAGPNVAYATGLLGLDWQPVGCDCVCADVDLRPARQRRALEWKVDMVGSICPRYRHYLHGRRQLQGKVWTDEELGPLRQLLDHPAWNVLVLIPFFVLLIMLSIRRLDHHIVPWVLLLLPSQMVMRLQQIVKPKVGSERLLAWQSLAPIHSEHWGEPR